MTTNQSYTKYFTVPELLEIHQELEVELKDVNIELIETFPRGDTYNKLLARRNRITERKDRIRNELLAR